jgi:hypothetical protein
LLKTRKRILVGAVGLGLVVTLVLSIVGPYVIGSTDVSGYYAIIIVLCVMLSCIQWLLWFRAYNDVGFRSTYCIKGKLKRHKDHLWNLFGCCRKPGLQGEGTHGHWLSFATTKFFLTFLFEMYQLSSVAIVPGVFPPEAPSQSIFDYALPDEWTLMSSPMQSLMALLNLTLTIVLFWLVLTFIFIRALRTQNFVFVNTIPGLSSICRCVHFCIYLVNMSSCINTLLLQHFEPRTVPLHHSSAIGHDDVSAWRRRQSLLGGGRQNRRANRVLGRRAPSHRQLVVASPGPVPTRRRHHRGLFHGASGRRGRGFER